MPNMYQEYLENFREQTKKFGPKVAIFLMVGIFYEMYDILNPETGKGNTTFSELIDLLGLKVSVKKGEGPDGFDGLVAGIPDYCVHKWAAKLTQLGWTVVLVEQVKNVQGKVVKRNVERILTPGTHVEAATSSDLFICSVFLEQHKEKEAPFLAVSSIDLTTGHLHVFENQAQGSQEAWTSNELVQFMELYPPREVLWSIEGSSSFKESVSESKLKHILASSNATFHQRQPLTEGAWVNPSFREEFLKESCSLKSLLPTNVALHLAPGSRAETSLLFLLHSLKELWPSMSLGQILVYPWVPGSMMCLGENALVQLHMLLQNQEQGKTDVLSLVDKTSSPMGKRALRERLLKPSANPQQIQGNLDAVEIWIKMDIGPFAKRLRGMTDIQRLYRKIQQGSLTANDLITLDSTFKAMQWISETLDNEAQKDAIVKIRDSIFRIFDVEKVYQASEDQSIFLNNLVPDLDTLEEKIRVENQRLSDFIGELSSLAGTQDGFKPEFRESSLVVKGPRGLIQTLQASKKLPVNCIAKLNKTGSHIESPILDQIFVILLRLRASLKRVQAIALIEYGSQLATDLFDSWIKVSDWISEVDVNSSLALVARENGYVKPTILVNQESSIDIQGLRHPLLEAQDRKIPYVQHNVGIGSNTTQGMASPQGWLLYGLNASGKSSLMRAVGLSVLLAQGGSFVPCSQMTLAPFTSLHTRIINTDNLWMGLSSFAVEMSELRNIFREAGPKSLVLGDELCSGTETTSATALVAAGLKGLLNRGARFLFATHLHGLSKIQEVSEDPKLKIWHLHVEYDKIKDKLVYHRTLREGSGSSLYGLEVAKAMRIPDDILEDAIRFRKTLAGEKELLDSVGSSWNSSITKVKCEICGLTESSTLEVHHIKERHMANKHDILNDNSKVHSQANLVVLCDECHDKVHAGNLQIGLMIQTSDGLERTVITAKDQVQKRSKWSEEQLTQIKEALTKFPKLSMASLSKYLLNQHNIQITGPTLKKMVT